MCVFKNHAFIYFLRPPSWSGTVSVLPSAYPYGDIGSGNPSKSMTVIGLSLPILRQRWCCLMYDVYWLLDSCCIWSRGSRYLNNWALKNLTKALNRTKRKRSKQKSKNKTANKRHRHWAVDCFDERLNCHGPILARVKYLCDYGIDNCNSVLPMC